MAKPIAVAGSAIVRPYSSLPGTVLTLDGSGSYDPDGTSIDAYQWTLLDRPTGSAAALTGATTVAPTLTPDVVGTYLTFLRVQSAGTWSEAVGPDAPDSAYCAVVVTTRNQALRIPGAGERAWAPHLYDALAKLDAAVGVVPGGPAPSLQTTGSPVVISSAAPPVAGKVLTASSATAAEWQAPASADPPTVYHPLGLGFGTSGGNGGANWVRTATIYVPPMTIAKIRWRMQGHGTTTDRVDIGLYSMAGALLGHIGLKAPYAEGGTAATFTHSLTSPLVWGGGNMLLAFSCLEGNISIAYPDDAFLPSMVGLDVNFGRPTESASGGTLPASISVPVANQSNDKRMIWVALLAA